MRTEVRLSQSTNSVNQRPLFNLDALEPLPSRGRLDVETESFLDGYREHYRGVRSDGAVRGEISQLRSVVREASRLGRVVTLPEAVADAAILSAVLTTPAKRPSATTALIRLGAINAALRLHFGDDEGRRRIDELDRALPRCAGAEWHQSGVVIAGERKRRRPQSPTIEPDDLRRIVDAAAKGGRSPRALRDRLLVAMHCFSGLEAVEIRLLRWSDLRWESEADSWSAAVIRCGRSTRLAIFGVAASLLIRQRLEVPAASEHVFSNSRGGPLTERQMRRIVLGACSCAGFPRAARNTLLSACAAFLSAAGLRDHDVAIVLGIEDMRTINRLLKPHQRLAAQRDVPRLESYDDLRTT